MYCVQFEIFYFCWKVEYKRNRLLTHPVVAALIHDKWKSIYGVFSFAQWLIYIVFLCCITTLLFKLPNPSSTICIATKGIPNNDTVIIIIRNHNVTTIIDDNVTQLASNTSCSSNATEDCSGNTTITSKTVLMHTIKVYHNDIQTLGANIVPANLQLLPWPA